MRTIYCLVLLFVLHVSYSNAQTVTGDIDLYLNEYILTLPGSNGNHYTQASLDQLDDWEYTIREILDGNISLARTQASSYNYQILEYTDTTFLGDNLYYVLEEKLPQINYWGTYVFNSTPCRDGLIIQAPHPKYDINTASEAIYCFSRLSAKALFLSGTHRCNHSSLSNCDGSTTACSDIPTAYRISDMAHNTLSAFQKSTEILNSKLANAVFIQLHGFTKLDTDPYVIMSNGTNDIPPIDYISQIKTELNNVDPTLTFKIPHLDLSWNRLVGYTNTQGRLINGSLSPCNTSISVTTGRFIHIEQEKTKLREDSIGWHKMYTALLNTFACNSLSINETDFSQDHLKVYPNPILSNKLTVEVDKIKRIKLVDVNGRIVLVYSYNQDSKAIIDLSSVQKGMYFLSVETKENNYSSKIIKQ